MTRKPEPGDVQRTGRKGPHGVPYIQACCSVCSAWSQPVVGTSHAAPELSGLEKLGTLGWTYAVDFYAMCAGMYRPVCPTCTATVRAERAASKS
jgi:hypothetical protein